MVRLLSMFFRALPLGMALWIGRVAGTTWFYLVPLRRGVALANVASVFRDRLGNRQQRELVRRCFQHHALYAVECLRLPGLSLQEINQRCPAENAEVVDEVLARGRGLIVPTAHLGNYDLFGCAESMRGRPLHVIVKTIKWSSAQKFWNQIRRRAGFQVIAAKRSKEEIRAALHKGEVVAMLIDQHMAPHRAIVTEFFGKLAATTPAPVRFARETGAGIVPARMIRQGLTGKHQIVFEPEFILESPYEDAEQNLRHNTERLNRMLERWILEDPEQWLWMHRRWKVHESPDGWDIPANLRKVLSS